MSDLLHYHSLEIERRISKIYQSALLVNDHIHRFYGPNAASYNFSFAILNCETAIKVIFVVTPKVMYRSITQPS